MRIILLTLLLISGFANSQQTTTGCTKLMAVRDHVTVGAAIAAVGSAECHKVIRPVIIASYNDESHVESVSAAAEVSRQLQVKDSLFVLYSYPDSRCRYYRLARIGPVTKIYTKAIPSCGVAKLDLDRKSNKLVITVPAMPNKELDFTSNVRFNLKTMNWE